MTLLLILATGSRVSPTNDFDGASVQLLCLILVILPLSSIGDLRVPTPFWRAVAYSYGAAITLRRPLRR